ncbi:Cerato-platanin [Choiromyces venosus 120613-1]|uniref:Cerato-platanin n=1 Tax=Choiromyces venosus 120613-1 TaxID=1336337 RepID=A0A3N4J7M8_9PEZI|nr:Cerato-platanin [Choiromyces venosus 120613-1]
MQFSTAILSLMTMAASAFAQVATTAAYDTTYDTSSLSTLSLACSDGPNGLYTKGYQTLGALPGFPHVGAIETIAGWNSPNCGKCYKVTYTATGASINIIGVDVATSGIVLSLAALNELTGGQGQQLGRVAATYAETAATDCGFPA